MPIASNSVFSFSGRHLRDVVDHGGDQRICPAQLVAGEDGHHDGAEEAILQPAPAKGQMQAIDDSGLKPDQVNATAHALGVPEQDVVGMNQRLTASDYSLNVMVG